MLLHDETLDENGNIVKAEEEPAEEIKQQEKETAIQAQSKNSEKETVQVMQAVAAGNENMIVQGLQNGAESNIIETGKVRSRPFDNGRNLQSGDQFYHDEQVVTFDSWQDKPETIAGKGCRRKIDNLEWLQQTFQRFTNDWKKKKQWATVTVNGERGSVDIHWYEEPKVGRVAGKVKVDDETKEWFYPDG